MNRWAVHSDRRREKKRSNWTSPTRLARSATRYSLQELVENRQAQASSRHLWHWWQFLDRRARCSDLSRFDNCNGNFGDIASSRRSERRPNSQVPSFTGGKPSHGARSSKTSLTLQLTSQQRSPGNHCTIQIHLFKFIGQVLAPAHKEPRNQVFYVTIGAVVIMFQVPSSAIRTTS